MAKQKRQKKTQKEPARPAPPAPDAHEEEPFMLEPFPAEARADVVTDRMVARFMRRYLAARTVSLLGNVPDDALIRGAFDGVTVRPSKHDAALLTAFAIAAAARERTATLAVVECVLRRNNVDPDVIARIWPCVKAQRGPTVSLDADADADVPPALRGVFLAESMLVDDWHTL